MGSVSDLACLACLALALGSDARLRLPLAAHRTPSTQASWCTFDRGGVRDERRACRAWLLALLWLHIPGRGGFSFLVLVAMRSCPPGQTMEATVD